MSDDASLPSSQMAANTPRHTRQARVVDVNVLIRWMNALVTIGTIIAYRGIVDNDFVNGETVLLAAILGLQTHVVLMIERRRRDPMVILLTFIITMYYELRILTLTLFPFSFTLPRFPYEPADSNASLLFILIANVCLYAGLLLAGSGAGRLRVEIGTWRATKPVRAIVLTAVLVSFNFMRGDPASQPRILQVAMLLTSQGFIILMALAYYLLFRRTLSWRVGALLLSVVVVEMVLHTLAGSRSALVYTLQNILMIGLAIGGSVAFRRRLVLMSLALVPALVASLVISFVVSTLIRASNEPGESFSLSSAIDLARVASDRVDRDYIVETGLPTMLSRAGFFDYSADLIAHRRSYVGVINLPAYGRSIVDNILTPGFDVFDQPRIANSMMFAYQEIGEPSKTASVLAYQSDQLGIYGELYVLFQYAALPVLFLVALLMKRLYLSFDDANPFMLTMKRIVVLAIFVEAINSFGMDWTLMDVLTNLMAIYVYAAFFRASRSAPPAPAMAPVLNPAS